MAELKLFNTLGKQREVFTPLDANNVRMYVCGPTVYDFAHIGNARPVIVFDAVFRLLQHVYGTEHVTYARNITDVDDKINARAARDFPSLPLNEAIQKVTEKTTAQYHHDVAALGCLPPTVEPRATGHIEQMQDIINRLIDNGHAYVAENHVLFEVKSWTDDEGKQLYGRLARRTLDDMIAGARVEVAPYKRDAMDFVLWKPSTDNEPGWNSPWGVGRPGWHIECSAMSWQHLGEVFDIHGGGIDLTFPHHENELAQSMCALDTRQMAQVWMHNGFLQVEGQKMSKSLGNFITIHQLLESDIFGGRSWPGEILRLAMLLTHYREPIDFSVRKLEEAANMLAKWPEVVPSNSAVPESVLTPLLDDLNTPQAIKALHQLAQNGDVDGFSAGANLLGVKPPAQRDVSAFEIESIERRIAKRLDLIAEKNWTEADKIRDDLSAEGIQLKDGKNPETGQRTTAWEVKK